MDNYFTIKHVKNNIIKRSNNTHKGSYGKIGIIAGSKGMSGSVCMSSLSSLRTGTGLVFTIVPSSISNIISIKLTECIIKDINDNNNGYFSYSHINEILNIIDDLDCIALGPGIGTNDSTIKVVKEIINNYKKPIILDADGLNCISKNLNIFTNRKAPTIITPHPKEFKNLLENSNINSFDNLNSNNNRIKYSCQFSKQYNVITLLKGYKTIIANTDGKFFINSTGNPGMATAGSGDVLTGIITSLVGQKIDCFKAACCGAYLHGYAGDLTANEKGQYGMIATDIIENIPYAIKNIIGI